MRLLGIIIVILLLIIGADFWINHKLQVATDDLIQQIDQVTMQIKENQWHDAEEQTEKLETEWKEEAEWWPIFLEHQEMDNIEFSMAKFKEYVATENNSLSLGQLSELRTMIEHIPKKEAINIKNIL